MNPEENQPQSHIMEYGRGKSGFWVKCSCGEGMSEMSTSGMIAGWIGEHDPALREMKGSLE